MVSWARPCEGKADNAEGSDKISSNTNGARHVQQRRFDLTSSTLALWVSSILLFFIQAQPRLHIFARPSSSPTVVDVVFMEIIGHQHLVLRNQAN